MTKGLNAVLSAREIAEICGGEHSGANFFAHNVSTDTRTLQAGDLFLALRGTNFRGEDFLLQAQEKGAVAAIVQEKQPLNLPQIVVRDTRQALTTLGKNFRARSQATFFAITGTNGKTSTKEMLQTILRQRGQTLATRGNLNNDIGVPLTLLRLREEDQFAVIEMGANHGGEITHLTKVVCPDIVAITNVSAAHLAGFCSLEGVIAAKQEIYEHSHGAIVLNLDLPIAAKWQQDFSHRPMATFSLSNPAATVFASDISPTGEKFTLHLAGKTFPITWQLQGRHNIANALTACAAAYLGGLTGEEMQNALTGLVLHQSRLSAYTIHQHTIFDDTYNANPASFAAAIEVLKTQQNPVLIAGAMGELGEDAPTLHQQVAHLAMAAGIQDFWAVGEGLAKSYLIHDNISHFPDTKTAGQALKQLLSEQTPRTVLVKGSRSSRMEDVFLNAGIRDLIKKG